MKRTCHLIYLLRSSIYLVHHLSMFYLFIYFKGMSTRKSLFLCEEVRELRTLYVYICFFVQFFLEMFAQLYDIKYSYLTQIICKQILRWDTHYYYHTVSVDVGVIEVRAPERESHLQMQSSLIQRTLLFREGRFLPLYSRYNQIIGCPTQRVVVYPNKLIERKN